MTDSDVTFMKYYQAQSMMGVLRGLYCQLSQHAKGKLMRVVQGEGFNVAVDICEFSAIFGQRTSEISSTENEKPIIYKKDALSNPLRKPEMFA